VSCGAEEAGDFFNEELGGGDEVAGRRYAAAAAEEEEEEEEEEGGEGACVVTRSIRVFDWVRADAPLFLTYADVC
jgi:hypothetical protein